MLPSPQSTPNLPADKSSHNDHRLPLVQRSTRTKYRFVRTDLLTYNTKQLRGLVPNESLSDPRPRRGIRRPKPTGDSHLEPSLLPIQSACSEYPRPVVFVYESFPNHSTGPPDELVSSSSRLPPVKPAPPSATLPSTTPLGKVTSPTVAAAQAKQVTFTGSKTFDSHPTTLDLLTLDSTFEKGPC